MGLALFSTQQSAGFVIVLEADGQVYQAEIVEAGKFAVNGKIFSQLFARSLPKGAEKMAGRQRVYLTGDTVSFEVMGFDVMPGFSYRFTDDSIVLKSRQLVIRKESLLEKLGLIQELCTTQGLDFHHEAQKVLFGLVVYSAHNERTYRILGVDFNSTPLSKFEMSAKESHGSFLCSYQDYFSARYGLSILDTAQPMITVHPLPGQ